MNKSYVVLAAFALAAAGWADTHITVNAGVDCSVNWQQYADRDDDDSWYDEDDCRGAVRTRVEWQWHSCDDFRVLRFRRVSLIANAWSFAPWEVKVQYCFPGCHLHHIHSYYVCERDRCNHKHCQKHFFKKHGRKHCYDQPSRVEYRYYNYQPKQQRHESPAFERHNQAPVREYAPVPPAPVRRPPIRPVPGMSMTDQHAPASVILSKQNDRDNAQYRLDSTPHVSDRGAGRQVTRVSGRERIW